MNKFPDAGRGPEARLKISGHLCRWCKEPLHRHARIGDTSEPHTVYCEVEVLRDIVRRFAALAAYGRGRDDEIDTINLIMHARRLTSDARDVET